MSCVPLLLMLVRGLHLGAGVLPLDWHDLFAVNWPLVGDKVVRSGVVYLFLLAVLRFSRRELAALNPFDLIVLMTLSNALQNAIIGNDNTITGGLIGAAALIAVNRVVVRYMHRHKRLERAVIGAKDVLVRDGKILKDHLNRELITRAELTAACHKQGIGSLAEVERAVLEPTGTLTFLTKTPSPGDEKHHELLAAIEHLREEVRELRAGRESVVGERQ